MLAGPGFKEVQAGVAAGQAGTLEVRPEAFSRTEQVWIQLTGRMPTLMDVRGFADGVDDCRAVWVALGRVQPSADRC